MGCRSRAEEEEEEEEEEEMNEREVCREKQDIMGSNGGASDD